MRIQAYVAVLIIFLSLPVLAQDIHFSQYNNAPLQLNPALTGVNACNYRAVVNYRNQWNNIAPYRTLSASYDMTLGKLYKSNYAGIGGIMFVDRSGDIDFTTAQAMLSGSYSLMLTPRGNQFLTSGIQAGVIQRSFDASKMTFDSQWGPNGFDEGLGGGEVIPSNRRIYADVGVGFLYNYTQQDKNFYTGFAVAHLNQPNQSFMNELDEKLYMKWTIHGGGHFPVASQIFLLPSYMLLLQGPASELNVGSLVRFKKSIIATDPTAFYVGGYYRLKDAFIFATRIDYGNFNLGISYDVNLSKLSRATSGIEGAAEISIIYTGCLKNMNTVTYCPFL